MQYASDRKLTSLQFSPFFFFRLFVSKYKEIYVCHNNHRTINMNSRRKPIYLHTQDGQFFNQPMALLSRQNETVGAKQQKG